MKLSDEIAKVILQMLDSDGGTAMISRNDLAEKMGCVPSQISYVIASRFTPEQGYIVESRRGGGGFIRLSRICCEGREQFLMHVVNSLGDALSSGEARIIIENLCHEGIITKEAGRLMAAATCDNALRSAAGAQRETLRAEILKYMLVTQRGS